MDGTVQASATYIDTGSQPITYFAIGEEYSPTNPNTAGHLYIDDVVTKSS